MERRYVPLRSATPPTGFAGPRSGFEAAPLKKRRMAVSKACNDCRKRKVRCDGGRPVCSNCLAQNLRCEYRDEAGLSKESRDLVLELIFILNQLPVPDLVPLLRRLGAEADASTILAALRDSQNARPEENEHPPGPSVSLQDDNMDVVDGDELSSQYPAVYPPLGESKPHLFSSHPHERSISTTRGTSHGVSTGNHIQSQEENASHLCDPRLHDLDIKQWSTVDIPNDLAAKCISLYLKTDHPLLCHFNPNLFISDLIAGRNEFCSSLLVNALLYWGCQMFSAIEPETDALTLSFSGEAERLWDEERRCERDCTLNLAATVFLSLGYLGQGRDHHVLKYLAEATDMGCRMGLFGDGAGKETEAVRRNADQESQETFTAWGVFNWTVLMSLFYHQPGIHIPSTPPQSPIPEKSPTPASLSPYMGYTFPYLCRFWKIIHGVGMLYHEEEGRTWGSGVSVEFAELKFRELLAWGNSLPSQLGPQHENPHHVKIMHIWFHAAVLDIFRPIVHSREQRDHRLQTFLDGSYTPYSIYQRSTAQLKCLLVDYRLRYTSSSLTILWHTALIYVANAILDGDHDEDWYPYILFCLHGYEELSKSWRVARAVSKGLLSMALRTGHMSGSAARRILRDLDGGGVDDEDSEDIRATFMMDLGASSPASSTVEKLAGTFEENADMQDFTNVFDKETIYTPDR